MRVSTRSTIAGPSAGWYRAFDGRTQNVSTSSASKPTLTLQLQKAVEQHAGRHEQQHCQRDLGDDEAANSAAAAGPVVVL